MRPLISVLGAQAVVQYGRSFPATMAAGMEAIALAESNDTPELASLAAGVLALCSAAIGDREACEQAAALLRDVPEPERRAMGPIGLGYLALNQGRLDDADAPSTRGRARHVADRPGARALGAGVGRDADPGRPTATRRW